MCGQTEIRDEYVRRAFRRLPAGSVVISLALVVLLASIATGFEQTVRAWGQAMPLMTTVFVLVLAGAVMEIRLPSGRRLAPVAMTAGLSASVLHAIDGSPDFDVRPAVVILLVASAQAVGAPHPACHALARCPRRRGRAHRICRSTPRDRPCRVAGPQQHRRAPIVVGLGCR